MIYAYYPGCSLRGSSKEYDRSTQAVCEKLGIELKEISNWICCGASSGHSTDEILNIGLPAKNLMSAEIMGHDLAVPCAACYNRLKFAKHAVMNDERVRKQMKELLGYDFKDSVEILNLLEVLEKNGGISTIISQVVNSLSGLKAACYYGCLLIRPKQITNFDDPEHPGILDEYIRAIGAEPVPWSYKTECCGGSLSLTRDDIVIHLVDDIIKMAREAGAHIIVTLCPLCMENLDLRQHQEKMPVLYLTELLGLAFGIEGSDDWMHKHLNDPTPVLNSLDLLS